MNNSSLSLNPGREGISLQFVVCLTLQILYEIFLLSLPELKLIQSLKSDREVVALHIF